MNMILNFFFNFVFFYFFYNICLRYDYKDCVKRYALIMAFSAILNAVATGEYYNSIMWFLMNLLIGLVLVALFKGLTKTRIPPVLIIILGVILESVIGVLTYMLVNFLIGLVF